MFTERWRRRTAESSRTRVEVNSELRLFCHLLFRWESSCLLLLAAAKDPEQWIREPGVLLGYMQIFMCVLQLDVHRSVLPKLHRVVSDPQWDSIAPVSRWPCCIGGNWLPHQSVVCAGIRLFQNRNPCCAFMWSQTESRRPNMPMDEVQVDSVDQLGVGMSRDCLTERLKTCVCACVLRYIW